MQNLKTLVLGGIFLLTSGLIGQDDDIFDLSPFEVRGEDTEGYLVSSLLGATRTKVSLMETSQNVTVLNREFLQDTNAESLIEALKYVSGISSDSNLTDEVVIRGFRVGANFTDGLRDVETQNNMGAETFLFDRVEVLKGPSAIVYGSHNNGGVINRVRKKPSFENAGELSLAIGNHEHYSVLADWTGPVQDNVAVRLVGVYRDQDGEKDFDYFRRVGFFPMVTIKPSENNIIDVVTEFRKDEYYKRWGSYFLFRDEDGNFPGKLSIGDVPRDLAWGNAENSFSDNEKRMIYASWQSFVNDQFSFRLYGQFVDWDHFTRDMLPVGIQEDNQSMPLLWREITDKDERKTVALDVVGKLETWNIQHSLLAIVQYDDTDQYNYRVDDLNRPVVNVFDIDHEYLGPQDPSVRGEGTSTGENFNISVQDQMSLFEDKLVTVIGLRWDDYKSSAFNALAGVPGDSGDGTNTSYKFGTIYKPSDSVSLFFNYSETFQPIYTTNPDGRGFDPTEGIIMEAGIKTELIAGILSGTLSVFELDLENILGADPDPDRASAGYLVQEKEQTNEGVEIDLNIRVQDWWTMIVSAATLKAETPEGSRIRGVPEETFSIWNRFDLRTSDKTGWSFGAGYSWRGDRPGDSGNSFFLDSFWTIDGFVRYSFGNGSITVNASNLTDEVYAERSINRNIIFPGAARALRATLRYNF